MRSKTEGRPEATSDSQASQEFTAGGFAAGVRNETPAAKTQEAVVTNAEVVAATMTARPEALKK